MKSARNSIFFGNREVFIRFLNQFGELLESKAKDILNEGRNQNVILLLENILNKVDSGILVMDQNLKISRINQAGKKLLFIQELNHKLPPITFHETGNQYRICLNTAFRSEVSPIVLAGMVLLIWIWKSTENYLYSRRQI